MTAKIEIAGFTQIDDGRVWTENSQLGLVRVEDGRLKLLDADGYPTNHALTDDHAAYVLRNVPAGDFDAGSVMCGWDNYATSI